MKRWGKGWCNTYCEWNILVRGVELEMVGGGALDTAPGWVRTKLQERVIDGKGHKLPRERNVPSSVWGGIDSIKPVWQASRDDMTKEAVIKFGGRRDKERRRSDWFTCQAPGSCGAVLIIYQVYLSNLLVLLCRQRLAGGTWQRAQSTEVIRIPEGWKVQDLARKCGLLFPTPSFWTS